MAKEDFCFTYYDGDATRDMSHMTRLQRGAYSDVIIAIRKFGHLSEEQVKMTLSKDFEECWPPIKLIMKVDEEGKFYIEWLENSLKIMRASSKKQSDRKKKFWENLKGGNTTVQPQLNHGIYPVKPLESGNENENEKKEEGGTGEEEKPFGHILMQRFLEINPGYSSRPARDMTAIVGICDFILQEKKLPNDFFNMTAESREIVLPEWERLAEWYRDSGEVNDLSYIEQFKIQKIFNELKNGKSKTPRIAGRDTQEKLYGSNREAAGYATGF